MVSSSDRLGVNDSHQLHINDLTTKTAGIERERSGKTESVSVPKPYRTLASNLAAAIARDGSKWPASLLYCTSRAGLALQSMSDRNFGLAPQSHKQWCANALRDCERAWADHGAHMKGPLT